MRINLDTDNITLDELNNVIYKLRVMRDHKRKADALIKELNELLAKASEEGYDFIDKAFGYVLKPDDFEIHDRTMY